MWEPLPIALYVLSGLAFVLTLGYVVAGRLLDDRLLAALALVEIGLLVQLVVGIAQLFTADRDVPAFTFVGYLLGVLVVLPIGVVWSLGEKSRSGTAVLLVATGVVPVLILRLQQIWATGA